MFHLYRSPDAEHHLSDTLDALLVQSAQRRHALRWLAAGVSIPLGLAACGGGSDASSSTVSTGASDSSGSSSGASSGSSSSSNPTSCAAQPQETAGPYPADGSLASNQRLNVLTQSGIVRQDIRSSLSGGNTAGGVPLTLTLQLVNTNTACSPLAGYAVYAWHCTREGLYSLYSTGITAETYLRGVQQADANGLVTFTTIVPGCYDGRYPHVHFEVYPTLASAIVATNAKLTSQLTFPAAMLSEVYATADYATSKTNFGRISLASDNVFGNDSGATQISVTSGSVGAGYTAKLVVGISA